MHQVGGRALRVVPSLGSVEGLQARAEQALADLRRRLTEDCPTCEGPESARGRACPSRLQGEPVPELTGTDPLCRHTPPAERSEAERQHTAKREQRLRTAGYGERFGLEVIPRSRGFVVPPAEWLADADARRAHAEAVVALGSWMRTQDRMLVALLGGVGSGKSFHAASVVAAWDRGDAFWLHAQIVDRPRRWDDVADRAERCELLVLDDLGLERGPTFGGDQVEAKQASRWGRDQLGALLQHRMNNARPTVVTGNLERANLSTMYGGDYPARLFSRLKSEGLAIPMGTHDLRAARARALKGR